MSTITITEESRAQILFDTFQEAPRRHDMRTKRGQTFKAYADSPELEVKVGVAELVCDHYNRETHETSLGLSTAEVLLVSVKDVEKVIANAVDYIRDLAPTQKVYDSDYKQFEIPNVVRFASKFVRVEESPTYRFEDINLAFEVVSVSLEENGEPVVVTEVVNNNHSWVIDGRRYQDDIETLMTPYALRSMVENHRSELARIERVRSRIAQVKEEFVASPVHESAVVNAKRFLETPSQARDTLDDAIIERVKKMCQDFLNIVGKTTLEVSLPRLFDNQYYAFGDEREAKVIDHVLAMSAVVHRHLSDNVRTTAPSAMLVGPVLQRFYEVLGD